MTETVLHFLEIVAVVVSYVGAQAGVKRIRAVRNGKKHNNPDGERRRNFLTSHDRDFIRECFDKQTTSIEKALDHDKSDLLRVLEKTAHTSVNEVVSRLE